MINQLSKKSASFFINNKFIPLQYEKLAIYGFEQIYSSILSISIVFLISMLMNSMLEGFIFIFLMVTIRQKTGGYHADTILKCNTLFITSYSLVLFTYLYIPSLNCSILIIVLNLFCLITTIIFAPVSNLHKPLDIIKKKHFKRISIIIVSLLSVVTVILNIFDVRISFFVSLTLLVISILMIAGYLKVENNSSIL